MQGRSQRCFRGHNGPVTTLADTLLGNSGSKVLASGGEDCTVRLWSVGASGKQHPLLTYHGHEKPLSFVTVARYEHPLHISFFFTYFVIMALKENRVINYCDCCTKEFRPFISRNGIYGSS